MDIRLSTVLIVKRGSQFLVGRIPYSLEYRWSNSPYDAWRTRERESARTVARRVGGDLWLFNPVVGQARELREEKHGLSN